MALDKDILGIAIYNALDEFQDVPVPPELMEVTRLNFAKAIAEAVIHHIKTYGVVTVDVTGTCEVDTTGDATEQSGGGPVEGTGTGTMA